MSAPDPNRPRRYFSYHYVMFRILGLGWWHHPDENDRDNFPSFYLAYSVVTMLVWVVGFVGLETIDPFTGDKDMSRFMFSLAFVITHNLTVMKLYLFFFKNRELQEIVYTLEVSLHEFYQNNVKNKSIIRASKILTASYILAGYATIANSTINGVLQDLKWRSIVAKLNDTQIHPERTLPQPVYIPWDVQKDGAFITAFTLEVIGFIWTGHIVLIIDTFIGSVLLHISGQFVILQEAFETVYERTIAELAAEIVAHEEVTLRETVSLETQEKLVSQHFTEDEIDKALLENLDTCIKQHQVLISCVEKFSTTYSNGFLVQLASSTGAICVIMVRVSQDVSSLKSIRFATSLAFFFTMVAQLAIQCFTANDVTLEAQKVSNAVAACRWERALPTFRRRLLLVMVRAQKPIYIKAGKFAIMDNPCFLGIVKAAYSYYAVISQQEQ